MRATQMQPTGSHAAHSPLAPDRSRHNKPGQQPQLQQQQQQPGAAAAAACSGVGVALSQHQQQPDVST